MSEKSSDRDLKRTLNELAALEQVPPAVSRRFHETLDSLASGKTEKLKKNVFQPSTWQFSLAASFLLVFAGTAIFLSGSDSPVAIDKNQSQSQSSSSESTSLEAEDQLLYSADKNQEPENSPNSVIIKNSGLSYDKIESKFVDELNVGNTFNDSASVEKNLQICLTTLELGEVTNLIDTGTLDQKEIFAIWSPISKSTWNIYLVDMNCQAIDKRFIRK
jgi:hypothetical protein